MAGDAGTALGAAAMAQARCEKKYFALSLGDLQLGPAFNDEEIELALRRAGVNFRYCDQVANETAHHLAGGKIVGWFQGRMEVGPRALGNRSLLASPLQKEMKETLNAVVKKREAFRPLAPSV